LIVVSNKNGKLFFEPRKEGYKDIQDPVNPCILPFLVQDNTHPSQQHLSVTITLIVHNNTYSSRKHYYFTLTPSKARKQPATLLSTISLISTKKNRPMSSFPVEKLEMTT